MFSFPLLSRADQWIVGLAILVAIHLALATVVIGVLAVLDRGLRTAPARIRHRFWSLGLWSLLLPASGLLLLEPLGIHWWSPLPEIELPVAWLGPVATSLASPTGFTTQYPWSGPAGWLGLGLVAWALGAAAWVVRLRRSQPAARGRAITVRELAGRAPA